eukprot:15146084-Ditylum_brightwellii.AAC.1
MSDLGYTNQAGGAFIEILTNLGPYDLTIATSTGLVTRARREAEHQEKERHIASKKHAKQLPKINSI